jgi:dsDNA-specific endonuclease/ATPase MutS2
MEDRWEGGFIALGVDDGSEVVFDEIEVSSIKKKGIGILHSPEDKDKLSHEFITSRAGENYTPTNEGSWGSYKGIFMEASGGESFWDEYPGEDREPGLYLYHT